MPNTKPQIKIVNCETGEEIVRDATNAETAQIKLDADNAKLAQTEAEAKATARKTLLEKLGISADEAQLLLG